MPKQQLQWAEAQELVLRSEQEAELRWRRH